MWAPQKGDTVWLNHPDSQKPLGTVVDFVADELPRGGQPIIEALEDEPGLFGRKKGDRCAVHPMFLLPFPWGGQEWTKAEAEGRVR
jgi:hypothetical protein